MTRLDAAKEAARAALGEADGQLGEGLFWLGKEIGYGTDRVNDKGRLEEVARIHALLRAVLEDAP